MIYQQLYNTIPSAVFGDNAPYPSRTTEGGLSPVLSRHAGIGKDSRQQTCVLACYCQGATNERKHERFR